MQPAAPYAGRLHDRKGTLADSFAFHLDANVLGVELRYLFLHDLFTAALADLERRDAELAGILRLIVVDEIPPYPCRRRNYAPGDCVMHRLGFSSSSMDRRLAALRRHLCAYVVEHHQRQLDALYAR